MQAPDPIVFEHQPKPSLDRQMGYGYGLPNVVELTRSKDGEMLSHFEGYPHLPRKGFIYAEAVEANNKVKKEFLLRLLPFACKAMILPAIGFLLNSRKKKLEFIDNYLQNFIRAADSIYLSYERPAYLKKEYYCNFSKAVWDFTTTFLKELGLSDKCNDPLCELPLNDCPKSLVHRVGKVVATLFEYDDAYKIRPMDILTETDKETLLKDPRGESNRLLLIFKHREPSLGPYEVGDKIITLGRLLSYSLLIPKLKKAFKKAIENVNFNWLQLDESEYFWNLNRTDYHMQGRTFKDRMNDHIARKMAALGTQ